MDATRALLDQLMGKDRNLAVDEKSKHRLRYDDAQVCQYFNIMFCTNELFVNTKSDLGNCNLVHEEKLRQEYQEAARKNPRMEWDLETKFIKHLEDLIEDCDKKIRRGLQRLEIESGPLRDPEIEKKLKERDTLDEQIKALLIQMEKLGEEGKIEESQALLKLVEELKNQKAQIKLPDQVLNSNQEKRMKVCEICSAFLVINDADQRVQSHLEGKQHVGYSKVREALATLKSKREGKSAPSSRPRSPRRSSPHGRSRNSPRRRSRSRSRDRDRGRNHRDSDRDRDRDHRGSRSSSRDRRRR